MQNIKPPLTLGTAMMRGMTDGREKNVCKINNRLCAFPAYAPVKSLTLLRLGNVCG